MKENTIDENDIDYTNSILDEKRDLLFEIKGFKSINDDIVALNEKIELLPSKYRKLFEDYDHLFHKAYEYEICLMYFSGLQKGTFISNIK